MANEAALADHSRTTRVGRANRNLNLIGRSWLYFVQEQGGGLVKIGRTRQLSCRLSALASSTPRGVTLLGTIPETWLTEQRAHSRFHRDRVRGEWFNPTPEILALADAGRRVFANGYVDTTDDDEAWFAIAGAAR